MILKTWFSTLIVALTSVTLVALGSPVAAQAPQPGTNHGLAAMDRAAKANRYLFIFFYGQDDSQTRSLGQVFNDATNAMVDRADSIVIRVNDTAEGEIVARFGVSRAPMPLVLALAPNGAVAASFPSNFTKEQLTGAFGTPCMEKSLGALQQGKLVLLCVQNGKTRGNEEAMSGVRAFKADQKYGQATEIVMLDPGQAVERPFLAKLGINGPVEEATTLFMAPPGSIIGSFRGPTDKNQLVTKLTSAISSCAAGCQPGGQCCPPAK